jgi:hypothetical protein
MIWRIGARVTVLTFVYVCDHVRDELYVQLLQMNDIHHTFGSSRTAQRQRKLEIQVTGDFALKSRVRL